MATSSDKGLLDGKADELPRNVASTGAAAAAGASKPVYHAPFLTRLVMVVTILIMYLSCSIGCLYMHIFPLMLINKRLYHRVHNFNVSVWYGLAVFLIEKFCGIKIRLHTAKSNRLSQFDKGSLVIMNHRTRLDWLFYFCVLYRLKRMSRIKIILKDDIKQIPGPAWAMQIALFIFIKRKWDLDKETFSRFISYYGRMRDSIDLLIFPEGTNYCSYSRGKSHEFADANGLKRYEQVLHPRTTGFIHVYNEMTRNQMIDCVQDVTVAYRGGHVPENELKFVKGHLPDEIHFFLESFGCEQIAAHSGPATLSHNADKNLESWLLDRWSKKEDFLKSFYAASASASIDPESNGGSSFETVYGSQYDLVTNNRSLFLFLYPLYWFASIGFLFYLIYSYFLFKVVYGLILSFYVFVHVTSNNLDELVMNTKGIC